MKATITLFFVLFIGVCAQAQDSDQKPLAKVETVEVSAPVLLKVNFTKENSVARLYRFKNAKVKKELSFSTTKATANFA